jgi:atrial natriuretic peptide receptor A
MDFLHRTFLSSHGYLHSSNCVIDGRFILKVTDFHFPMFRPKAVAVASGTGEIVSQDEINHKCLLWRAPEHLRSAMPPNGTQKGDSFSCGIVLQEIAARADPYCDHSERDNQLSCADIVRRVAQRQTPPFRPALSTDIPKEIAVIIQACWTEDPQERPSFRNMKISLKNSKLTKEGNIMDNLLKRMEKYAQDLEALVAERTGAFFEEKKKAEELLYQVMPK